MLGISTSFYVFKTPKHSNSNRIIAWKSKELSEEVIKPPATSVNNIATGIIFSGTKIKKDRKKLLIINRKSIHCLLNKFMII